MTKRSEAISKEDWYMAGALLAAQRSKDPNTQVGACIVNNDGIMVAIGYNGFPRGCDDDKFPWAREAEKRLDTKYPYVVHAEVNAILNRNIVSLYQCRLYNTLFPCNECAKHIIQAGIEEIVYFNDKYHDTEESEAARRMFSAAKIKHRQYEGMLEGIKLLWREK